ncbi:protein tyrosine phosphatase [Tepidicaulis marinus]|uniref:protein-tyrosine-phosphatase n=1 Tax=Tepidicaulis marinus TaxID=1333998 RepID=A0A081B863_9HYPH|nr:low molecular weight protein-tyrosine-phosphatase [Tepidicaulis marinus]GAK44231.1 protein tyrosine phosphatase [Tepidicaulis marinus]
MVRVLFVCLGNICRSPMAEGVLRVKAQSAGLALDVASAGTGDWHVGEAPDLRAQEAAAARGYDITALRGRLAVRADFSRFDYLLAMDRKNLAHLQRLAPTSFNGTLRLFLDYAPDAPVREVPDPYFGSEDGFAPVLDLIEEAADGLIRHLRT